MKHQQIIRGGKALFKQGENILVRSRVLGEVHRATGVQGKIKGARRTCEETRVVKASAFPTDGGDYIEEEEPSRDDLISKLNASLDQEPLSGEELRGLIEDRWGRLYDTRICRRRDGLGKMRLYLQVM